MSFRDFANRILRLENLLKAEPGDEPLPPLVAAYTLCLLEREGPFDDERGRESAAERIVAEVEAMIATEGESAVKARLESLYAEDWARYMASFGAGVAHEHDPID